MARGVESRVAAPEGVRVCDGVASLFLPQLNGKCHIAEEDTLCLTKCGKQNRNATLICLPLGNKYDRQSRCFC